MKRTIFILALLLTLGFQYLTAANSSKPRVIVLTNGYVDLRMTKDGSATFVAPTVTEPKTIHIICQATDTGRPNLTGFQRVIITVVP